MQDTSLFKPQGETKRYPKSDAWMLNAFIFSPPSVLERMLYSPHISSYAEDRKEEMDNLGKDLESKIESKANKYEYEKPQGGGTVDTVIRRKEERKTTKERGWERGKCEK